MLAVLLNYLIKWCGREDLNLHTLRQQILSLPRLPFRHAREKIKNGDPRWTRTNDTLIKSQVLYRLS